MVRTMECCVVNVWHYYGCSEYKSHDQMTYFSCTTSAEDFAELQQAEFVWGSKLKIKGEYWRAS